MKEDKLLNDLFESARTEEPKVSYEEVADSFMETVPPTGVLESVKELLLNNISLNSILVVATSGTLLTAALMMSSPSKAVQHEEVISQNIIIDDHSISEVPTTEINESFTETGDLQESNNKTNTSIEVVEDKTEIFFPKAKETTEERIVDVVEVPENQIDNNVPPSQKQPESELVSIEKEKDISEVSEDRLDEVHKSESTYNTSIANKPLSNKINATNGYNEPFTGYGTNLRRLKRSLLNNLMNDRFIDNKKDAVVIEIEEKQIVINGIKLKPYLYTKYTSIAQDFEIVPEENRQIRINDDLILVGDFTEEGFRGKAEGQGNKMYLADFKKDIQLGKVMLDLSPVTHRKSKISFDEQIMQEILNLSHFDDIFKKDKSDKFLPLTLLTNNHFSDNLPLDFRGQSIKLIRGEASLDANNGLPIIFMKKYKFGNKKGTIKFLYDGYEITVNLRRLKNDWLLKKLYVTGKGRKIDAKF